MAQTAPIRRFSRKPSSAKLPGVKDMIYHPALPTLRRMDRDDVMRRLPTEHSRTTTDCTRDDFLNVKSSLVSKGGPGLIVKSIVSKEIQEIMEKYKPVKATPHTGNWTQIMTKMNAQPGKYSDSGSTIPEIEGLAVRKKHPLITSSWAPTYYVRPATAMDGLPKWHGQKALPTHLYARYRRQSFGIGAWK